MKRGILALAAALALACTGAAHAAYRAIDVGPGWGFDVNSTGVVVGQSADHAFVWTAAGGQHDLGTLGGIRSAADHVTESGQVVGYAYLSTGYWHTFSWTPAGGLVDVGTLGGANSSPWDVSDAGQVVGQSNWAGFPPSVKAFSWTPAGGMVDLGMLGLSVTIPYAVNEAGQVVGFSSKPFVWSQDTGIRMLSPLPGYAADINDHGRIVGTVPGVDGPHVVVWPETGEMIDIGLLGPGGSYAFAINNEGDVAYASASHVMFVGPAGQPIDIGTLGGSSTTLGGQFPGTALNDAGQLVGRSTAADGTTHAFVWSLAAGMVDLGPGQATAISENGLIVGTTNAADGTVHATLWRSGDTTPPQLVVADVATDATSPAGRVVQYTVAAVDDTDPLPTTDCTPASGSLFRIGDTTVTCTATDASQNSTTASFVVHVRGAEEQAANLVTWVRTLSLPSGLETSLCAKLALPTVYRLAAFVHQVDAQTGKTLADVEAAGLREAAERIEVVLGG